MKRNSIYGALLLSASLFSGSAFADTKMTVVTRDGAEDEISVTENGFIFFKDNFMINKSLYNLFIICNNN